MMLGHHLHDRRCLRLQFVCVRSGVQVLSRQPRLDEEAMDDHVWRALEIGQAKEADVAMPLPHLLEGGNEDPIVEGLKCPD